MIVYKAGLFTSYEISSSYASLNIPFTKITSSYEIYLSYASFKHIIYQYYFKSPELRKLLNIKDNRYWLPISFKKSVFLPNKYPPLILSTLLLARDLQVHNMNVSYVLYHLHNHMHHQRQNTQHTSANNHHGWQRYADNAGLNSSIIYQILKVKHIRYIIWSFSEYFILEIMSFYWYNLITKYDI